MEKKLQMNSVPRCRHRIITALGMLLLFSAGGCSAGITRDELLRQMTVEKPPLVVDVRSQGEYDRGHLPAAVHIPFTTIGSGLKEIGFAKRDVVVLYCEHGPRASIAGFSLFLAGYDKVYTLEGHMKAWRKNEFPIETVTH